MIEGNFQTNSQNNINSEDKENNISEGNLNYNNNLSNSNYINDQTLNTNFDGKIK